MLGRHRRPAILGAVAGWGAAHAEGRARRVVAELVLSYALGGTLHMSMDMVHVRIQENVL